MAPRALPHQRDSVGVTPVAVDVLQHPADAGVDVFEHGQRVALGDGVQGDRVAVWSM